MTVPQPDGRGRAVQGSAVQGRCAVHPVRPAVDACPVCGRLRCGPDAAEAPGGGCGGCGGSAEGRGSAGGRQGGRRRGGGGVAQATECLVRGALAAQVAGLLGGVVAAQYVEAGLFAYLTPFVVGVLCGAAAQAAAGGARRGRVAVGVRALSAVVAVLGVGLGFLLEGSRSPLGSDPLDSAVLLPYLAAVAGALLWTAPPRARPDDAARVGGHGSSRDGPGG